MSRRTVGSKEYHHPLVGDLTVTYQALSPADDPDQILSSTAPNPAARPRPPCDCWPGRVSM
ncbi:MmyB family transcriptional regulator [Actinoplanes sp. RD1]|uniref:MmyB family transcriptional regulator n=1 Tax=Actinoplanes sp. RD1 TaxID=3064538 RepID=UPI003556B7EF